MASSFAFGDWLVEADRNRLVRGETQVKMDPKAMQVLVYLAEHKDDIALKEDIIKAV
jgi:DNA-binding winged helix-turn-helix (wHTH) protein